MKCINIWKICINQWTSIFQKTNAWSYKTTHASKIHSKCKRTIVGCMVASQKDHEIRLSVLFRWALNQMTSIPVKERREKTQRHMEKKATQRWRQTITRNYRRRGMIVSWSLWRDPWIWEQIVLIYPICVNLL